MNNLKAQMIYLPDTNFRNKLINLGYGSCIVADSIDSSCPLVASETSLTIVNFNIHDLQGIQAFVSLTFLDCGANQLTNLPSLPNSLTFLWCGLNQLTSLPSLPNSLTDLVCGVNQLTSLPSLPNSLKSLNCNYNQLTTLPVLPNSMNSLVCNNNQLTDIPELPDSLFYFVCDTNPNLQCLPQLKRIVNLSFTNTNVSCLPNYGSVTNSNPPLSSLPLCGIFNPNGCNSFWNISGKTYFDSNINCLFDFLDVRQPNMHIMLYKDGNLSQQVFTGGEGLYSFNMFDTGNYKVELDTTGLPFHVLCPASFHYTDVITATDSLFYDNDFAIKCKPGFDLGAWSIEGIFEVGHQTMVNIQAGDIADFYGAHCAAGVSGSVTVALDGPITYLSPAIGALIPDIIIGDTIITYNISDFGTLNFSTAFNMVILTDTLAVVDSSSSVCISVSVAPTLGDINPANNSLTQCFDVVASFDPNEKEVYPFGDIDLSENQWLTYTIHFQNTGNAPAEHIYIDDTLNANLDLSTFQLLAYSHQPLVQILEGGIARFNFPNINLPDSNTNEPASHGYVQYKIKVKDNAVVGTQINNTAYIYFDFNTPVVTNTTMNTVTNTVGITNVNNDLQLSVFPNPTHNEFTVYYPQFMVGKKVTLKLLDLFGKELIVESMKSSNSQLSTNDYPSGIYFLRIETTDGVIVKKLVKE